MACVALKKCQNVSADLDSIFSLTIMTTRLTSEYSS